MTDELRIGRRRVPFSHPDKLLFTDPDITKRALGEYYASVAPAMLPHLRDRPLALQAFPGGISAPGFFLKRVPPHFPPWIATATVAKRGGTLTQVVASDAATLVYLAGQNVVTPHVWLSRADAPDRPDRLIIDLDPSPGVAFAEVRAAAREAVARLRDAGLTPFALVTGSRGIHVACPLRRGVSFPAAHAFARGIAEEMVAADPERLTLEWHRAERGRRIYLDVNRVAYAQHVAAPYSARPRFGGPIAMPIALSELEDPGLTPDRWTIRSAPERILADGDPWQGMGRHARTIPTG